MHPKEIYHFQECTQLFKERFEKTRAWKIGISGIRYALSGLFDTLDEALSNPEKWSVSEVNMIIESIRPLLEIVENEPKEDTEEPMVEL